MSLEMTPEQQRALIEAMAFAVGRVSVMAKSSYSAESVASSLPMLLEVAWPLVRDMVLEEAAKRVEVDGAPWLAICPIESLAAGVRAMKGKP